MVKDLFFFLKAKHLVIMPTLSATASLVQIQTTWTSIFGTITDMGSP